MIRVFVSATTTDLGTYRQAATNLLLGSDFQPVVQPTFSPDERPLSAFLRETVASCDVVICLVGFRFGAYPESGSTPLRSYTQLEYDFACEFSKPIFVFFADEACRSIESPEPVELRERQELFRKSLLSDRHIVSYFRSVAELDSLLLRAQPNIRRAAGRVPVYFRHVPPAPAYFVGRNEELDQLRAALARRIPGVIAVIGIGGQGKTSLVHRVLRERSDLELRSGFWCTASVSGYSFDLFLDNVLEHLSDGRFDKQRSPSLTDRVTELLRYLQKDPILIVIDRLESWLTAHEGSWNAPARSSPRQAVVRELDDFLQQASGLGNGSHLVVTSRVLPASLEYLDKALIPVREEREKRLGLEGLDPDAAVQLLRSLDVEGEDEALKRFARQLGCHPLALRLVGAFAAEHFGGRLSELPPLDQMDPEGALQGLFGEIDQRLPSPALSRRILQVLAHSQDAPSLDLVQAVLEGDGEIGAQASQQLRGLLKMLARFQLVNFDAHTGLVEVHPLVQTHFAAGVSESDSLEIHRRYSQWFAEQSVSDRCATLEDVKPRLLAVEHALLARDAARCRDLLVAQVSSLQNLAEWFAAFGHFTFGKHLISRVLDLAEGPLRLQLSIMRSELCIPVGEIDQAIRDLDVVVDSFPPETSMTLGEKVTLASALSNRGNAHLQMAQSGGYRAARKDFDRAVELFRELRTRDSACEFGLASALVNRGNLRREVGQLSVAIDDFTEAMCIHTTRLEPVLQKIDPELAAAALNRGNALSDLRRLEEAIEDYQAAGRIFATLVRIGRAEYRAPAAHARILVATVLQKQRRHGDALAVFDESLSLFEQFVDTGKSHLEPTFAFGLLSRALSFTATGKHDEALRDSDRARNVLSRLVSEHREDIVGSFVNALFISAVVNYNAGRHETAGAYREAAVSAATRLILRGENDLRLIMLRYTIACAQSIIQRRPEEGRRLMEEAAELAEATDREWSHGREGFIAEIRAWLREQADLQSLRACWPAVERLRAVVERT